MSREVWKEERKTYFYIDRFKNENEGQYNIRNKENQKKL